MKLKNDYMDVSTRAYEHSKLFLKSYSAVEKGIKLICVMYVFLLKHSISNGLEILVSLSKIELRSMCVELKFHDVVDISKDDMIKSVSDEMNNNYGGITNGTFTLIEKYFLSV